MACIFRREGDTEIPLDKVLKRPLAFEQNVQPLISNPSIHSQADNQLASQYTSNTTLIGSEKNI